MLKEFRTQRIIWDKANSRLFEPVQAVEGDERGRRLEVQIVNAGVVEDLGSSTLSLAWQSPDGHKGLDGFEVVDASNGIFELYYPTGMLANKGRLRASLVLYETNGKLESREFDIYVQKTVIDNDAVESSDSFTALTDAVVRINEFDAQLAQTVGEIVPIEKYGAVGDGITDDTQAFKNATTDPNMVGKKLKLNSQNGYLIKDTLEIGEYVKEVVGTVGGRHNLIPLLFDLPIDKDALVIVGRNPTHSAVYIDKFRIDMQGTGRDGLVYQTSDNPQIGDIEITRSGRDAFVVDTTRNFHYVEGLHAERLRIHYAGRHAFRFTVRANGNFFNESQFTTVEVRGLSERHDGGAFIYADVQGTSPSGHKISMLNFLSCNVDANRQVALDNGHDINEHMIVLKKTPGFSATYEGWTFLNGGYESMTGGATTTGDFVHGEEGIQAKGWFVRGVTIARWTNGRLSNNIDVLGNTLTDKHMNLPSVKKLTVGDSTLKTVNNGGSDFIATNTHEKRKLRVTVTDDKTDNIRIKYDINKTGAFLVPFTFKLLYNGFYDSAQFASVDIYNGFVDRRTFKPEQYAHLVKQINNTEQLVIINSVAYDNDTKDFILNVTTNLAGKSNKSFNIIAEFNGELNNLTDPVIAF